MASMLLAIFNMSISGIGLILVMLIGRSLLNKVPSKYTYIFWILVFTRLVFPIVLDFPSIIKFIQGEKIERILIFVEYIPQSIGQVFLPNTLQGISFITVILVCLFSVWVVGFIGICLYEIISYSNAKKSLSTAIKIQDNVYETDQISSPFIFGLIQPKIYLPLGLGDLERRYVLCHERVHLKRKDYIIKFLQCIILAFHWFNPFVWVAFKYMSLDMEMSCDEEVIVLLGEQERKKYAQTIFNLSKTKMKVTKSMLTFGASDARVRISNMLNKKKISLPKRVLFILGGSIVFIALITHSFGSFSFNILKNSIHQVRVKNLISTDLSGVKMDGVQIGSSIEQVNLNTYAADLPLTRGNYAYYFNHLIINIDSQNKVNYFFASTEAVKLSINGHNNIVTIDDVTKGLGYEYLDEFHDRAQGLKKYIYYDKKIKVVAEFIYAEYDRKLVFVTIESLK